MRAPELDRDAVVATIRKAGELALRSWRRDARTSARHWEKDSAGPVSEVDLAVDALLHDELRALLPEAGWLSEERADDAVRLDKRLVWIVDPIDGTRDFVRGRDGWAISVALVADGRPVDAFIHAPARDEMWQAGVDMGAVRNGAALGASDLSELVEARIVASHLPKDLSFLKTVARPNSIALRMSLVAAGEADLVAATKLGGEWDLAAADLIASEAGARVTNLKGETIRYNQAGGRVRGIICAVPGVFDQWSELVRSRARKLGS